jgi:hypothetical protein
MIHYRALFAELLGEPAARLEAKAAGDPTTTRPDGLPVAEEPVVEDPVAEEPVAADQSAVPAAPVGPAAADTTSPPAGNPARNRTPDAVTTARQQER